MAINWTSYTHSNPLEKHLREVVDRTWNFAGKCKTWDDHVLNAAMGLAGEAGEVLDVHKKHYFHADKDRRAEVREELGDVCFYLPKAIELWGFTLEECCEDNKVKLFSRYGITE